MFLDQDKTEFFDRGHFYGTEDRRGKGANLGKLFEKCQNYRFLDIISVILNKMKDTLDQECIKGRILSF